MFNLCGSRQFRPRMIRRRKLRQTNPTGKISLYPSGKSVLPIRPSFPGKGGVSRSSRTREGMRWTRASRETSVWLSVRRSRVVLTPRCWRQVRGDISRATVAKKPGHRGEREVSRKAIAQGMSECFRCPVCSCAPQCALLAHETAGAARTRHSLRPLIREGATNLQKLGRERAARTRKSVLTSSLREPKRRAASTSPRQPRKWWHRLRRAVACYRGRAAHWHLSSLGMTASSRPASPHPPPAPRAPAPSSSAPDCRRAPAGPSARPPR